MMVVVVLDGSGDGQHRGHVEVAGAKRGGCRNRHNNQIETTAAAMVGGDGGNIRVMDAIDNGGDGQQGGGGKQGRQRRLWVLSVPSNGQQQMGGW